MIDKQWKWILFGIMVLAQLYIAISMTTGHEKVITEGHEYKFRVAPADPNDPLRGKYMRLTFADREVPIDITLDWKPKAQIGVFIEVNEEGYAIPARIVDQSNIDIRHSVTANSKDENFAVCMAQVQYINRQKSTAIIEYPFNRLYMNENKAPIAEEIYAEAMRDTLSQTYALVSIGGGKAVLQDVYIDNVSLSDLVDQRTAN